MCFSTFESTHLLRTACKSRDKYQKENIVNNNELIITSYLQHGYFFIVLCFIETGLMSLIKYSLVLLQIFNLIFQFFCCIKLQYDVSYWTLFFYFSPENFLLNNENLRLTLANVASESITTRQLMCKDTKVVTS